MTKDQKVIRAKLGLLELISALGPGLFLHLEKAARGLENLAFRFLVDDPLLHTAPFEATVRLSGQPPSGAEDVFTQSPFVLVNAPIARRTRSVILRTTTAEEHVPRQARLLFIRSQVGENPGSVTGSDTVAVTEIDQATGRIRIKDVGFRKLQNLDFELKNLEALRDSDPDVFYLEKLDLSQERDPKGAETVLLGKLAANPYDVVHFAGHSITSSLNSNDPSKWSLCAQPCLKSGLMYASASDGTDE
jgi:hypothetical protein